MTANFDFPILYAIQNIRCDFLDKIVLALTKATGSYGQIWLVFAVLLLIFRKTRKAGLAVILSYALVFVIGQFGLKDLIARIRPCNIDLDVQLIVSRPSSYSCPSTHSAWAFAGATAMFMENRKLGIPALVLAVLIAFSRLYLFVHFPTDVIFGIVMGILLAIVSVLLVRKIAKSTHFQKLKLS